MVYQQSDKGLGIKLDHLLFAHKFIEMVFEFGFVLYCFEIVVPLFMLCICF
jgi:hypothetical protein